MLLSAEEQDASTAADSTNDLQDRRTETRVVEDFLKQPGPEFAGFRKYNKLEVALTSQTAAAKCEEVNYRQLGRDNTDVSTKLWRNNGLR